jgi:hypothetical protein
MPSPERNVRRPVPRYETMVARFFAPAALVLMVLLPAAARSATPSTLPVPASGSVSVEHARDGGVIAGKIVSVDYVRGMMSLRDANRTIDVFVLPSTNIQSKQNGYSTISDLKKGASVEIFTSVVGTRTNAQIIKLK